MNANPYLPDMATIVEVIQETHNIKTFRVVINNEERMKAFTFRPGQVGQLSVFGVGESTFVINSSPTRKDYLQFSVMRVGEVTTRLHQLQPGDQIGVRAPLGNSFPVEDLKGKNIVFVGGGIGMAPLRTLFTYMLDNVRITVI
jgi:2-polyprenylphenol hydroxylase and related flavodoxin oxidoreductases